jgi:hypothetical protein
MMQTLKDPKRYRGFVLTRTGSHKLKVRLQILEAKTGIHQGARAIAERVQIVEPDGIHPMTVRKILRGQQGVDKRSIHHVFEALQLSLEVGDYAHTSLYSESAIADPSKNPLVAHLYNHSDHESPEPDFRAH